MKIVFVVPGEPQGKGRPRFSSQGGLIRTYTPKNTADYEKLIHAEYKRQCGSYRFGDEDMLDLRIVAYFKIPKSVSKKKLAAMESGEIRPTKKPDADNVLKAVADSLNDVAYRDDAQIVDTQVRKFYSCNPRLEVSIQQYVRRNSND